MYRTRDIYVKKKKKPSKYILILFGLSFTANSVKTS